MLCYAKLDSKNDGLSRPGRPLRDYDRPLGSFSAVGECLSAANTRRSASLSPNCPEAVVRLGSVALKSAGEVISDGRFTLLSATLGHRGNAEALSSNPNANSLRQLKMPAWTRHPPPPGPTPRAPRILATGCAPSATTAIQLVLSSATIVARRCT